MTQRMAFADIRKSSLTTLMMIRACMQGLNRGLASGLTSHGISRVYLVNSSMAAITRHQVRLSDGVTISLSLHPHPAPLLPGLVILLHGRLHNSTRGPCSELFPKISYSTLTYDARGMGESSGTTGWCNIEQEVDDLKEIISHIKSTFSPPLNQVIAIIGHSKGAAVAFRWASLKELHKDISQPHLYDQVDRPPLLISLSARYDTSDVGLSRFNQEQQAKLENDGKFVWLSYRAGRDFTERRDYVVTLEDVEKAKGVSLECVKDLRENSQVVLFHGRADGTVAVHHSHKLDQQLRDTNPSTSVDLVLVEGAKHNWDQDGEIEMLVEWIDTWIKRRAGRDSTRIPADKIIDHLGPQR
ncbi:hypothetical protein PGT21_019907 [Puccinia graminis f. sp. tritici]|uniref:Serine aminopeptidase S33 domain-containing protein n=1 Tax=Puccinia graminis f. sp. tritici TaxID=56615 RepID=A0A5B0N7Q4_PUCGR|nr:hypothetical protein PGTUg99_003355 [Puccinia graminis f. sp. tritici]KAA1084168.1 hypothetical protein PGT21_019907 [Puccinia graminis f. sp. tritici]